MINTLGLTRAVEMSPRTDYACARGGSAVNFNLSLLALVLAYVQ